MNVEFSNIVNKNFEAVQKTYELYGNTTLNTPEKKEELKAPEKSFDDAYSSFRDSIKKARESLVQNETISANELNSKLQGSVKKLISLNQKNTVDKINNISESQKESALAINDNISKTQERLKELSQKLDNLKVNKDISNINANITSSWINNMK